MSAALTTVEQRDLEVFEDIVQRGIEVFVEVGRALAEIRDRRLYRAEHGTFEEYCQERWLLGRTRAYQLIDASGVTAALSTNGGHVPANERQARELVPVLRDEGEHAVVEVWRELQAQHGNRVTAAKVRQAVDDRLAFERKLGPLKSSSSAEWYTPARYVEAARRVLGEIDLDPASCAEANQVVGAATFYAATDDGLTRPWAGRVWLNPAYGSACKLFVEKLLGDYHAGDVTAAICLVNAYATDVGWFQPLWDHTLNFTNHRIDFYGPAARRSGSPMGSVFVYLGPDRDGFAREFAQFGAIVERRPVEGLGFAREGGVTARVCACGCGASLDARRAGALYLDGRCRIRAHRARKALIRPEPWAKDDVTLRARPTGRREAA